MKKSYLCGLALLAPALLLTGCGGGTSSLSISANWYSNTGLSDSISGTDEHLEYAVSFRSSDITNTFKMEYESGTYTVDLKSERRELADGTTELVYVLTSALSVTGKYTLNGASSAPFTDTVECETVFHNARAQLKPVRSSKLFKSTVPNAQTPASLENACTEYHYTFVTEYANDLKSFKTIYTALTQETPTPT
ncbi:MAG: hypothetical protein K2L87_05290, partial [Clostridiales bacterium]|nr:hypothetical protein [Clostridiales bacterium]